MNISWITAVLVFSFILLPGFMFTMIDWSQDITKQINPKWKRVTIRLAILFAWPLVPIGALIAYLFDVGGYK